MEYEEKVFEVVRNFMEYKEYKGDINKAIEVILKKFPAIDQEKCRELFLACCTAYKDAIILVQVNHEYYSKPDSSVTLEAELNFRKIHSIVPGKIQSWIIGWIYHWYYER